MSNVATPPPEIEFDRILRYHGRGAKLDLEKLPSAEQALLADLQVTLNSSFQMQQGRILTSDGPPHCHFDYIDRVDINAEAFRSDHYAFVGLTLPMIHRLNDVYAHVSRTNTVSHALGLEHLDYSGQARLYAALFSMGLIFVSSHELGHHFHGHTFEKVGSDWFRSEINRVSAVPAIDRSEEQAMEVDADGYAINAMLSKATELPGRIADFLPAKEGAYSHREMLELVLAASTASLLSLADGPFNEETIDTLDHPPALVRVNYILRHATECLARTGSPLRDHLTLDWFQGFMPRICEALGRPVDFLEKQNVFVKSQRGHAYFSRLDARIASVRQRVDGKVWDLSPPGPGPGASR
jgi:hypothetical protein